MAVPWSRFGGALHRAELDDVADVLALLKCVADSRTVTFVYAAGDEERNSAVALKAFLERGGK